MFGGRGGTVVGDFHEDGGGEPNLLTGRDNEAWTLHELHGLPLGVASNSLVKPLVGDCRAVRMSGRHKRELEERRGSSVKHLDVHGVDLPKLLDQCCMVV